MIGREGTDADARLIVLNLTVAGKALVPRLAALADKNDAKFFGHLSAKQQAELRGLLEEIVRIHQMREVPVT